MSRKGTNIYKRKDGRWEARYVQSIMADGRKKYASVYGKSYKEVRDKQLFEMQNVRLRSNQSVHITLDELMWEWISGIANTVKKSTYQKYESLIRNHITASALGGVQLRFITGKAVDDFANEKLNRLSAKTVNDVLIIIGLAFTYAEETYALPKPRFHHIKEPVKETRVLSSSEQEKLERFLFIDMNLYKFGVLLTLYTGLRVGELCALNWEDVNDQYLVVSKTLHRIKDGDKTVLEITEPKTKASNRNIPLPPFLLPYIRQFKSLGYVMKTQSGNVVEPRLMQLTFEKMIKDCGLAKTNFHALRHTFATRCVEAGFDIKSLSEILGHIDVKTTLNKYVHSSFEQKQKNMELLKPVIEL